LAARTSRGLPRGLVVTSYAVGALLLTAFFVYLGFPYDLLVARYLPPVESATAMQVRVGDVTPRVSFLGPGFTVRDVRATREDGPLVLVDRLFVRPAWSLSWLTGSPAFHVDLASPAGAGVGTVTLGHTGGFAGQLEGVEIEVLPVDRLLAQMELAGKLDADIDLHQRAEEDGGGFVGSVVFDAREGSIAAPGLPIALPYESLVGGLLFGEEGVFVRLADVALEGPMLAATIEGQVGSGSPGRQPLDLAVRYEIRNPTIASMFGGGRGDSQVAISGTLQRPVVR